VFENVRRKVVPIVVLLLVSVGLMVVPDRPFRLGLDLKGGTRLVYRFDFEGARARGEISADEDPAEIVAQAREILRNRIDPTGTREISVRTEGDSRIVIELPGGAIAGVSQVEGSLAQSLDATSKDALVVIDGTGFSPSGVVEIGREQIRYARRDGDTLHELKRANNGVQEAHAAGAAVRLVNSDAIRAAIENLGDLSFVLAAEDRDFVGSGTDLSAERTKLDAWASSRPGAAVADFNLLPPDQGGPDASLRWYPTRFADAQGETVAGPPMAVLVPKTPDLTFRGDDLKRVYYATDAFGYPAVGFEVRDERVGDFSDFTGDNRGRRMAIVLNDEVRSAPNLNAKLIGGGIIEGRFKDQEVKDLVTVLRSGSLKLKPTLEHDERVGATLGDDYVQRGVYSSVLALVVVVAFMILYYRRLGVFAALALLTNMIMFMGGLAFLQATLTLPGIAGIVLTIGMAVDANILVFDRLREEAEKGRSPKAAAKAGFDLASSAIIDANLTTFLSALILYKLGTGPVRGFAATLMIGIATSVFAALVTTRVFVHWALARGIRTFRMGRWLAECDFDFLGKWKLAFTASAIVCLGGLVGFLALPDEEKLGLDFTGGFEAQLETAEPQTIDTMRSRVAVIPEIGRTAEVKPVLNSAQGTGAYTQFRVQFKTVTETVERGDDLTAPIHEALADLLLTDPIRVAVGPDGTSDRVDVELFFVVPPTEVEAEAALEAAGLSDVTVAVGARVGAFTARGTSAAGREEHEIERAIEDAFLRQGSFEFARPIPSSSQVGPQVVGEMRDKALLALAASLFVIVMYMRVRFAEYSFGIAAMVALAHDVLVALAALTLGNYFGIVNGEINLAMVAVFLTIIGFSVNDTIVIFDRVREKLPRSGLPLRGVLNEAINETLARTIATSLTVFLAILVQYAFNVGTGNVMESISFAMMFGTLSGVYSSLFVSNPIFLWLETRAQRKRAGRGIQTRAREQEREREARKRMLEEDEGVVVEGPA
jgi:SecD/SecF fusion protein